MNEHKDCIRTFSGQWVNVFDPDPDSILIQDIAHHLGMICRFAGALPMFYSVAQHSIMVANLVETPALKMQGLMHDASEAFMSDLARPLKQKLSDYKIIENNLMKVIAEKFEFEWPINNEVHEIDMTVFEFEKYHLLDGNPFKDFDFVILDPYRAKEMFIQKFNTYRNQL